jgi:hypothetical protein
MPLIDGNPSLSWTVGVAEFKQINISDSSQRFIERSFYLGTSPSLNLTSDDLAYGACAFYITLPNGWNPYMGPSSQAQTSQSQCQDNLGTDCVPSLINRVSKLSNTSSQAPNASVPAYCADIASQLQSNIPSQCTSLLSQNVTIHTAPLTGPSASLPFTASENSTSNCYPTLPKSNSLTRAFSYNITANAYLSSIANPLIGETPLISLFYDKEGRNEVVFDCLRIVDLNDISLSTMNNGSGDGGNEKGAAARGIVGNLSLGIVGLVVAGLMGCLLL